MDCHHTEIAAVWEVDSFVFSAKSGDFFFRHTNIGILIKFSLRY
jgi:hypothetical protein